MNTHSQEAAEHLEQALECASHDVARARDHARLAADLAAGDPELQLRAASVLLALEDVDGAADIVGRVWAALSRQSPLWAEFAYALGLIATERGGDAGAMLAQAFELSPEELEHGQSYARHLIGTGRYAEARAVVATAMRSHPRDAELLRLRRLLAHGRTPRSCGSRGRR